MKQCKDYSSDSDQGDGYRKQCQNQFESQDTPAQDEDEHYLRHEVRAASVSKVGGVGSLSSPGRRTLADVYDDDTEITQWHATTQMSQISQPSLTPDGSVLSQDGKQMTKDMDMQQKEVCAVDGYFVYGDDWTLSKSSVSLLHQVIACINKEIRHLSPGDTSQEGQSDPSVHVDQIFCNPSQRKVCRLLSKCFKSRIIAGSLTVIKWCTVGKLQDLSQLIVLLRIVILVYHIRVSDGVLTSAAKQILKLLDLDKAEEQSRNRLGAPTLLNNFSEIRDIETPTTPAVVKQVPSSNSSSSSSLIPAMKETPVVSKNHFLAKWRTPKKGEVMNDTMLVNNSTEDVEDVVLVVAPVKNSNSTPKRQKRMASQDVQENSGNSEDHALLRMVDLVAETSEAMPVSMEMGSLEPVVLDDDEGASVLGQLHVRDSTLVDAQLQCTVEGVVKKHIPALFLPVLGSLPLSKSKQAISAGRVPIIAYNLGSQTICTVNNRSSKPGPNQDATVTAELVHPVLGRGVLQAVADGHGDQGEIVASMVASLLPPLVTVRVLSPAAALFEAGTQLQQVIYAQQRRSMQYYGSRGDQTGDCGSTLACALIFPQTGHILTYSVGDSRVGIYGQLPVSVMANELVSTTAVPKTLAFTTHEQCLHTSHYEFTRHMLLSTAQKDSREFNYDSFEWLSERPTQQIPLVVQNPSQLSPKGVEPTAFFLQNENAFTLAPDAPENKSVHQIDVPVVRPIAIYLRIHGQQCFMLVHPLLTHTVGVVQGSSANTIFVSGSYSPRKRNVVVNPKYAVQKVALQQLERALQHPDKTMRDTQRLLLHAGRLHTSFPRFDGDIAAFIAGIPKQPNGYVQVTRCLPGVSLEEARVKKQTLSTPRSLGHGIQASGPNLPLNTRWCQPKRNAPAFHGHSIGCTHGRNTCSEGGVEFNGVQELFSFKPDAPFVVACMTDGVTSSIPASTLAATQQDNNRYNQRLPVGKRINTSPSELALKLLRKANATITETVPSTPYDTPLFTNKPISTRSQELLGKEFYDTALMCDSCITGIKCDTSALLKTEMLTEDACKITLPKSQLPTINAVPQDLPLPVSGSASRLLDSAPQQHGWLQYHKLTEQSLIVTLAELYYLRFQNPPSFPLMHETCVALDFGEFLAVAVALVPHLAYQATGIAHDTETNVKNPDNAGMALLAINT